MSDAKNRRVSAREASDRTAATQRASTGGPSARRASSRRASDPPTPVLQAVNVYKSFGKVQALNGVSLEVYPGEVLGLLGDNGAGKSTLIKIISGNFHADRGDIYLEGKKVRFDSPAESRRAGIETVYQNSEICQNASVAANFFIGRELTGGILGLRLLKEGVMVRETEKVLKEIGVEVQSVRAKMGFLSGGQRQAVILGRFFHWGGKVALLDEPFAALSVGESIKGLKLIRDVSGHGLPIILITHNIEHAFEVCTRYVVLRHGEVIGKGDIKDTTADEIVSMITGAIHVT
jgi:D-xylose transport system ATP-binding protein